MNKAPASLHGIQSPSRGRPSKVVKQQATPRARQGRRAGSAAVNDAVDPDLEAQVQDALSAVHEDVGNGNGDGDGDGLVDQQTKYEFEAQAAALAASAAQHHHQHDPEAMDLTAAAVLAGATNALVNSHEHHPELEPQQHVEQQDQHDGPQAPTTEQLAEQSGYENVNVESALAKRLAREGGMRLATQRRPEQVLNLGRRSNVEALFAHIAGETAPVPCKNCHKGHGPWTTCVVVDGQMCGSCANCWFNASGARCSFHETRNPQAHGGPQVLAADGGQFVMPQIPQAAIGNFNYMNSPASTDPVIRYTIERAMSDFRAADRKTRQILLIEATAKQLASQVVAYEETLQEEEQQQGHDPQQQQQQHMHDPNHHEQQQQAMMDEEPQEQ